MSSLGPKRYDAPWKDIVAQGWIAPSECVEVRVTLTDAEPDRVARLLAVAERDAPAGDAVRVLALDDPYLAQHGRAGIALLPPSAGRWFPSLPDAVRFDADLLQVSMASFLSAHELAVAREDGGAALLGAFGRGERDLLRFATRPGR